MKQNTKTNKIDRNFDELKTAYEMAVQNGQPLNEIGYDLAYAITLATLKPLSNEGGQYKEGTPLKKCGDRTRYIEQLRKELIRNWNELKDLRYESNESQTHRYNKNGDLVFEEDAKHSKNESDLLKKILGEGLGLVNAVWLQLIQEVKLACVRYQCTMTDLPSGFLDTEYITRVSTKQVILTDADLDKVFKDMNTNVIHACITYCRSCVRDRKKTIVISPNYSYIPIEVEDEQSHKKTVVYKRLPKYMTTNDLVDDSIDTTIVDKYIELLSLNDRQATIMRLMYIGQYRGYGVGTVAAILNIQSRLVRRSLKQIQQKCWDRGIKPMGVKDRPVAK